MKNRTPLIDKFRSRVVVSEGCWEWAGPLTAQGYGILYVPSAPEGEPKARWYPRKAHRFAYETFVGPVPDGLVLDHTCHTEAVWRGECDGGDSCSHRRCVRPDHLEPVTVRENFRRGVTTAGRYASHCKYGHEMTEANTHWAARDRGEGRPYRVCRVCMNIRAKRINEERKALTRERRAKKAA